MLCKSHYRYNIQYVWFALLLVLTACSAPMTPQAEEVNILPTPVSTNATNPNLTPSSTAMPKVTESQLESVPSATVNDLEPTIVVTAETNTPTLAETNTPTQVTPTPLDTPIPTEVPTADTFHTPTPVIKNVNTDTNTKRLSTLEIQEQIRYASVAGGAAPTNVDPCPNHYGEMDDWLVVGYSGGTGFLSGESPGIGTDSFICTHLQIEPDDGDVVTIRITYTDQIIEELSFAYGQPVTQQANLNLFTSGKENNRFYKGYYGRGDFLVLYSSRLGQPLGQYVVTLLVNNQEISRQELNVSTCDCPTMQVYRNSNRGYDDVYQVGDTMSIDFTGFKPNEELILEMVSAPGTELNELETSVIQYKMDIQTDDRGEYHVDIEIDEESEVGYYVLIPISRSVIPDIDRGEGWCMSGLHFPDRLCRTEAGSITVTKDFTLLPDVELLSDVNVSGLTFARRINTEWQLVDLSSTNARTPVIKMSAFDATWLRGGSIYFTSVQDGQQRIYLWQNGETTLISPDGKSCFSPIQRTQEGVYFICGSLDSTVQQVDLYLYERFSNELALKNSLVADHVDTNYSNDIIFTGRNGNSSDIFILGSDGIVSNITNTPEINEFEAVISDDSNYIVYSAYPVGEPDRKQIFVMSSDGSENRQITQGNGSPISPVWMPFSHYVAYISKISDSEWQLWLTNLDGSWQKLILTSPNEIGYLGYTR